MKSGAWIDSPRYMDGAPQKDGDVSLRHIQAESLADAVGKSSALQRAPSILLRKVMRQTATVIISPLQP